MTYEAYLFSLEEPEASGNYDTQGGTGAGGLCPGWLHDRDEEHRLWMIEMEKKYLASRSTWVDDVPWEGRD